MHYIKPLKLGDEVDIFTLSKTKTQGIKLMWLWVSVTIDINTGSTIQGDHILAFWQTQKSGSIPEIKSDPCLDV